MKTTDFEWFRIWYEDHDSIVATMIKNMVADLDAGYNPGGNCIKRQRAELFLYQENVRKQLERFATMEDDAVARWCYYDLKRRGVIS